MGGFAGLIGNLIKSKLVSNTNEKKENIFHIMCTYFAFAILYIELEKTNSKAYTIRVSDF